MRYDITTTGIARVPHSSAAKRRALLETAVDLVAAELEQLNAEDISISTDFSTCRVEIRVSVEKEEMFEAQAYGASIIRSALHAAGARTPKWQIEWVSASIDPEGDDRSGDCDDELIDA